MPIRTCFFDMGNVLVYFSHDRMCRNVATVADWPVERAKAFLFDEGRQWKLERGELTENELHAEFTDAVGRPVFQSALLMAMADIFELNDSVVPILRELRDAGQRLVLLSNTSLTHIRFIEQQFEVLELMHDRVMSYEVGAMKPDDRIFRAALDRAECRPDECFYTDDIGDYVGAAATLGIHSHLFENATLLRKELVRQGVLTGINEPEA